MSAKRLLDIPPDTLLSVFCRLDVTDVLCLEQTCKRLRDLIAARHLWLRLLQSLDQACAPDVPPHVDVTELSGSQLRTLVVDAVRIYHHTIRESAHYVRKESVAPSNPQGALGTLRSRLGCSSVALAPGGHYLFLMWSEDVIQIYDLRRSKGCVWTYRPNNVMAPEARLNFMLLNYTFEICRDGTVTVFICNYERENTQTWLEVHRLAPSSREMDGLDPTSVFVHKTAPHFFVSLHVIGDYAVAQYGAIFTVINWRQGWTAEIKCNNPGGSFRFSVLQNTVFFCEMIAIAEGQSCTLAAFQLDQVNTIRQFEGNPVELHLDQLDPCTLTFQVPLGTVLRPIATNFPWTCHQKHVVISLVAMQKLQPDLSKLVVYEFSYDLEGIGPARLKAIAQHAKLAPNALHIVAGPSQTRSGLLLYSKPQTQFSAHDDQADQPAEGHDKVVMKFGIGKNGVLFLAHLPSEVLDYYKGVPSCNVGVSMEYYSGTLVFFPEKSDSVDIWYPA